MQPLHYGDDCNLSASKNEINEFLEKLLAQKSLLPINKQAPIESQQWAINEIEEKN